MQRATTEEEVREPILIALRSGTILTTQEIFKAVKAQIEVVDSDRLRANERTSETKLDQIIANALQAGRALCRENLIERTGRGEFRITPHGQAYITTVQAENADIAALLDKMLPDGFD